MPGRRTRGPTRSHEEQHRPYSVALPDLGAENKESKRGESTGLCVAHKQYPLYLVDDDVTDPRPPPWHLDQKLESHPGDGDQQCQHQYSISSL